MTLNICRARLLAGGALVLALACATAAPALAQPGPRGPSPEAIAAAKAAPTPRTPQGRPDLTGLWAELTEFAANPAKATDGGKTLSFGLAADFGTPRPPPDVPKGDAAPPYKPEHYPKIRELAKTDVDTDPSFVCNPAGIPRAGPPGEIFQSADAVVLLYATIMRSDFRVIPLDGRPPNPTLDPSWWGDSSGRWEGDTLVITSTNFTDESWIGGAGQFHTDAMKVVERLTREGNALRYEVTVEDPGVFTRPWVVPPRTVLLGKAGAHLEEVPPCHERDQGHMVDKYHVTR